MTPLRWAKLLVLIVVPILGAVYAYQFSNQERELIEPFRPFKSETFYLLAEDLELGRGAFSEQPLQLREPVTLVNIWATWCPPCVEEFPAKLELQRRLEGQGFEIIFVSIDEDWADVEAFMATHGLDLKPGRMFWDPERKLAEAWGSERFPESYVLRPDGWVVEKIVGLQHWTRPAVLAYFERLSENFAHLALDARGQKQ